MVIYIKWEISTNLFVYGTYKVLYSLKRCKRQHTTFETWDKQVIYKTNKHEEDYYEIQNSNQPHAT